MVTTVFVFDSIRDSDKYNLNISNVLNYKKNNCDLL